MVFSLLCTVSQTALSCLQVVLVIDWERWCLTMEYQTLLGWGWGDFDIQGERRPGYGMGSGVQLELLPDLESKLVLTNLKLDPA